MSYTFILILGPFLAVLIAGIWYGPLFGSRWQRMCRMIDPTARDTSSPSLSLYLTHALLSLISLSFLITLMTTYGASPTSLAWGLWLGCIIPTLAGTTLWHALPGTHKGTLFLIHSGYYGIMALLYTLLLSI